MRTPILHGRMTMGQLLIILMTVNFIVAGITLAIMNYNFTVINVVGQQLVNISNTMAKDATDRSTIRTQQTIQLEKQINKTIQNSDRNYLATINTSHNDLIKTDKTNNVTRAYFDSYLHNLSKSLNQNTVILQQIQDNLNTTKANMTHTTIK